MAIDAIAPPPLLFTGGFPVSCDPLIDRRDDKSLLLPRQRNELAREEMELMEGVVGIIRLAVALPD